MPTPRTQPKLDLDDLAEIFCALGVLRAQVGTQQEADRVSELQSRIKRCMLALAREAIS